MSAVKRSNISFADQSTHKGLFRCTVNPESQPQSRAGFYRHVQGNHPELELAVSPLAVGNLEFMADTSDSEGEYEQDFTGMAEGVPEAQEQPAGDPIQAQSLAYMQRTPDSDSDAEPTLDSGSEVAYTI